jgi:hypothetical protein
MSGCVTHDEDSDDEEDFDPDDSDSMNPTRQTTKNAKWA